MIILLQAIIAIVCLVIFIKFGLGIVVIAEDEVGILVKRIGKALPSNRFVAVNGEAGYQAATLAPGWHFGLWPFFYNVIKEPLIIVREGEIGLVVARDGESIPSERILGQVDHCDNFQDGVKFLKNGGEKGRQSNVLTTGVYRINTSLFEVITTDNIDEKNLSGISKDFLKMTIVPSEFVGLVTVFDGKSLAEGNIAGPNVPGHSSFQNPKTFIKNGGFKGTQEDVLRPGSYTINPWFAKVETIPMTEIEVGFVGVVISSSGSIDDSTTNATNNNLVKKGYRGIWEEPLFPGKHALNTKILKVEYIPTTNIVLNWGSDTSTHAYDENLSSTTARTRDGFNINIDVSQIIHIGAENASKVIARVGSMQKLVDNIIQPIISNYFRNSCQTSDALDFMRAREEKQKDAATFIHQALLVYDVNAVGTLIGQLVLPDALMLNLTNRKIAEEQKVTFVAQIAAQNERKKFLEAAALAEAQAEVVKQEQGIKIANSKAQQAVEEALGAAKIEDISSEAKARSLVCMANAEATKIENLGFSKAKAYQASVDVLGEKNLTIVEVINKLADNNIKITPDFYAGGGDSSSGMQGLLVASLLSGLQGRQVVEEGLGKLICQANSMEPNKSTDEELTGEELV